MGLKKIFKRKEKLTPEQAADIIYKMTQTKDPQEGKKILREGIKGKRL